MQRKQLNLFTFSPLDSLSHSCWRVSIHSQMHKLKQKQTLNNIQQSAQRPPVYGHYNKLNIHSL